MAKLIGKIKEFFNKSLRFKYHELKKENNTNKLKIAELQELVNEKDKHLARLKKQNKKLRKTQKSWEEQKNKKIKGEKEMTEKNIDERNSVLMFFMENIINELSYREWQRLKTITDKVYEDELLKYTDLFKKKKQEKIWEK